MSKILGGRGGLPKRVRYLRIPQSLTLVRVSLLQPQFCPVLTPHNEFADMPAVRHVVEHEAALWLDGENWRNHSSRLARQAHCDRLEQQVRICKN